MLRGFRWQLVAFILALVVFAAAAMFRLSRQTGPAPLHDATPAATIAPTEPVAPTLVADSNGSTQPRADASVYREGIVGSVQRLNPLLAHLNPPDRDISSLIFEGLFAFNDYGEVVPDLAADLVVSNDGLEYVVRLRDDVLWQDGVPFTADDVVYTASLMSDSHYAEISPMGGFWQTVETQKLSQNLVRFRLAQPYSSFLNLLTIGILPEHALRGTVIDQLAQHPFNLSPIGTGAYQLARLRTTVSQGITEVGLVLSPTYRERREAQDGYLLRGLTFHLYTDPTAALNAYAALEVDALFDIAPPKVLNQLPQAESFRQLESTLGILIFNWSDTPFEERRVRQALALSIDVPHLVETHFGANATYADSPYISGSSVYQPHSFWTTYDLEQAETLLSSSDAAVVESGDAEADEDDSAPDQAQFRTLIIEDIDDMRSLADDIASQWQSLGLEFIVEPLDAARMRNRLETGRFDAAIVTQRIGADPDLFRFWHPAQSSGTNYGAAAHNEIAEILETARSEIYAVRRAQLFQQFQDVFAEQAIAIPIYYPVDTFVVRDTIEGIRLGYLTSPADRFRGIQDWRPATTAS